MIRTGKKTGLAPTKRDSRDKHFGFHRVFGSVSVADLPSEYDADAGLTIPNQNGDNAYTECTAYAVADIAGNQDHTIYSPDYIYMKTLAMLNLPPTTQGVDGRTPFKVACTFGLLRQEDAPFTCAEKGQEFVANQGNWPISLDEKAKVNLKPGYFPITGMGDFFDNVRSAMWIGRDEQRTVGMAIDWKVEFELIGLDGILPENAMQSAGGHMVDIVGWSMKNTRGEWIRNGEQFLKIKSWQGDQYADKGFCYMSRPLVNKLMAPWGTYAAALKDIDATSLSSLKDEPVDIIYEVIVFIQNAIGFLRYRLGAL